MLSASRKRRLAALAGPFLALAHQGLRRRGPHPDLKAPDDVALVRRVLAVRLDNIGDLLLTEPALGILRNRFPAARIDVVAGAAGAALLEGNPNVDRVIAYRAPWHEAWRGGRVDWRIETSTLRQVTADLRRERYDAGFELRGDLRDILFTAACRPAVIAGSAVRGGAELLDYDAGQDPAAHQVLNAAAIASAGLPRPREVRPPAVYLTRAHRVVAKAMLPEDGPAIALHLGAGFPSKQLPVEKVASIVAALTEGDPRRRFVVVGGPEDLPLSDGLQKLLGDRVCSLVGRLSLLETAAVLERCDLFMGNDSAPMHLAAAVSTPVVAWFGPSEPWRFRPYGVDHRVSEVDLDCRPCDYVHCVWPAGEKYQCMVQQDVNLIVRAAEELLCAI